MPDFVTLTCPSCGGKLQVTSDIERFACGHCGTEHVVRRSGGIVSLAPVVAGLERVQMGVDRTAAELAIARLSTEVKDLEAKLRRMKAGSTTCGCWVLLLFAFASPVLVPSAMLLFGLGERALDWPSVFAVSALVLALALVLAFAASRPSEETRTIERALQEKRAELARYQETVRQ